MLPSPDFVFTETHIFFSGMAIGLLISAPLGPVNVLCIQRTLERGFWGGVAVGLGALIGDGMIASAAALGLSAVSELMSDYRVPIRLVGGIVLIAFGLRLMTAISREEAPEERRTGLTGNVGATGQAFLLTVSNPGAILGAFAVFGGFGAIVGGLETMLEVAAVIAGVLAGGLCWWLGLSRIIATVHHRLDARRLRFINQAAGVVLVVFGAALLASIGRVLGA